jgi:DNA-binding protein Fis
LKDLPPEIHEWASKNDLSPKSAATSPGKAPDTSSSNVEAAPIGKPIIGEASIEDIYDQLYDVLRSEGQEGILDLIERAMIKRALVESDGNQVKTAGILGITRATLRKRIDLYK